MPLSISEHICVNPEVFDQTGAFDAILDVDSRLFIDPHLLQATGAPELSGAYQKVRARFADILKLLATSKRPGDVFWNEALHRFTFPELRGLCIGYSASGTAGRGMGPSLRKRIIRTAKEIVDAGINDPEIFELVGLFEDKVGPDLISDMVGRIIVDDLLAFTGRVFSGLSVPTKQLGNTPHRSVINPFSRYPLILIPKDILRDLPTAESWTEVDLVCAHNDALRRQVNRLIGDTWKKATTSARKSTLRSVLLKEPEVLRDLINLYKEKPALTYDFHNDPAGQTAWHRASRYYVDNFPLKISLPAQPSPDDLLDVVRVICGKFKDLVENNGLSSLFYDSTGEPKKEEAAQKLFYGIADAYCEANNIDLSRETNAGRGPVDFKFSRGYKGRVLVEAKLTTNPKLMHGFEIQIEEYKKAEKAESSIYLVIDVKGGSESRVEKLKDHIRRSKEAKIRVPEVVFIDATPKELQANTDRRSISSGRIGPQPPRVFGEGTSQRSLLGSRSFKFSMANDHYVPQFYLKNFAPRREPKQIYVYRTGVLPQLLPIRSVASEEDYYADDVDKVLTRQETESAQIIKKLLGGDLGRLTGEERRRLCSFIGSLANRTPSSQRRLHKSHTMVAGSFEDYCADREMFFHWEKAKGYNGTDDELEQLRLSCLQGANQSYLHHQPIKADERLMGVALAIGQDTASTIENRQWHILESTTSKVFVTSDNPVILTRFGSKPLQLLIGLRPGSVLLPLSPERCLLVDDKPGSEVISIKREKIDQINNYIIGNANVAVFANILSKHIAKALDRISIEISS